MSKPLQNAAHTDPGRYGPGMASITIPEISVRTTSKGTAYSHGVAAATGTTPSRALSQLAATAGVMATDLADNLPERAQEDAAASTWGLELVDVRLVPGPTDDGSAGWCAYGTLRSTGVSPLIPDDVPWHDRR